MTSPMSTVPVASLDEQTRSAFLVKVYQHLLIAIGAFIGLEVLLFSTGIAETMFDFMYSGTVGMLVIFGAFMVGQVIAQKSAHNLADPSVQYLGLFGMVAVEALIFTPFLYYFFNFEPSGEATVVSAAIITAVGFAALSAVALFTRKDLSFMRPMLIWAGVAALILIGASFLFGLELGIWFSVAMIALAGGSILYQTQTILRQYPADAYVGASVALFASVMMLFWYVLRLLSQLRR